MVVGPPGTGKTDTAVQILNVLYHNCPSQRTLIITHSNQALNDLFEKIMQVYDSYLVKTFGSCGYHHVCTTFFLKCKITENFCQKVVGMLIVLTNRRLEYLDAFISCVKGRGQGQKLRYGTT